MHAVQPRLPLTRLFRPRVRSVHRSFTPSQEGRGPYRLPYEVRDRLTAAMAPYRNREAAFALATFLGRFWSSPGRITDVFPIDRRELAGREDLGLTEAKVRGAIRVLEEIGFLDRALASGSKYKPTEDGLHRKPIRYVFGSEYTPLFLAANKRAERARGGHSRDRRPVPLQNASRLSTSVFGASELKCPKSKSVADPQVYLGHLRTGKPIGIPPKPYEPDPKLESALDRLLQGIRQSRRGSGNGSAK
jgi:hypothetical protein